MSRIGDLTVRVGADISDLRRGLDGATGRVQGFRRSIAPMVKTMAAVGAAATAAAVGVAAFTKNGMDAIDAQAKLARQLDSTIGGLRGLQLASEDAGVATGVINSAMERFSARLGEAQRGTGQAKDALDRLGLSASALANMDVDERMAAIADRVQQLGLSGAETADILRQFGIRNREIVNLLRQGGDAIRDARQEIEDYGLAVDAVDAGAIEAANDALSRVGLVMESVRNALSQELAPIILVIARRFNESARQAGGFGEVIGTMVESSVMAIGELLDKLYQIQVFNQQVIVATRDMELAFARFAQNTWNTVSPLFDNMTRQINFILNGLSKIPGMGDIEQMDLFSEGDFMERINNRLEEALGSRNLAQLDLNEMIEGGLPSDRVQEIMDDVRKVREEIAASINDVQDIPMPGLSGGSNGEGGQGGEEEERRKEELDRLREHLGQRVELLRESLMTEQELETSRYLDKAEELADARELEIIGDEEHRQMLRDLAQQHEEKMSEITAKGADERAQLQEQEARDRQQAIDSMMNNIISLTSSGSKKLFQIGKVAAIANAVMKGYEAVVSSYAWGARIGGPPLGAAMAAAAGAATFAQIQNIRSQQFSGGGSTASAGSAGGSGGSTAQAQQPQPATPSGGTLTVEGISSSSLFTGDAVRELAQELIDYQKRGGQVVIQ